jgi:hypothetical protein
VFTLIFIQQEQLSHGTNSRPVEPFWSRNRNPATVCVSVIKLRGWVGHMLMRSKRFLKVMYFNPERNTSRAINVLFRNQYQNIAATNLPSWRKTLILKNRSRNALVACLKSTRQESAFSESCCRMRTMPAQQK